MGKKLDHIGRAAVYILFGVYVIAALYLLFFMRRSMWDYLTYSEYFRYNTNFVPFRTIAEFAGYLRDKDEVYGDLSFVNIWGNLAVMLPVGIFFPAIWKKQRRFRVFALTAAAVIICVELLQFLTMRGSCDIDDFILNFFGAVIGFSLTSIKIVRKLTFVGKE